MIKSGGWFIALIVTLMVAIFVFAACGRGEGKIQPAEIHYGEDLCAECGMIISDPKFASSISKEIGAGRYQTVAFDDIGDMLAYLDKHPEEKVVGWFVHDYETEEWIDATTAFFVVSEEVKSPMNHGIAAHAQKSAAEAMAQKSDGQLFTWQEVQLHATQDHAHS